MLNEALRLIRVFHDLNKTQAADRVGLSKSYVTELERGDKKVTIDVLEKYSDAFAIPLSSLIFFAEQIDSKSNREKARIFVAGKTLKMLNWIAAVSAERDENDKK
jgi:transcriptional regulator with XRE-family HTH domain